MTLESDLEPDRVSEMDAYGRTAIYGEMEANLKQEHRDVLRLVNHGLTLVDDRIDRIEHPITYLREMEQALQAAYAGASPTIDDPTAQAITSLGTALQRMGKRWRNRGLAYALYDEVLRFWNYEARNLKRKNQILEQAELDELNTGIGASVATQFLLLLDPPTDIFETRSLARSYGHAIKVADNLCDYKEDIKKGFVNIPQEHIRHVQGIAVQDDRLAAVDEERLGLESDYIEKQKERIRQTFTNADNYMLRIRVQRPIWNKKLQKRLELMTELSRTWLRQAEDFTS